jgi:16S rRNA G1207 methylase RsmC
MRTSFASPAADAVVVEVPAYRGKRYLEAVAYAATRVAAAGIEVTWTFPPREAPAAVRVLEASGWRVVVRPSKRAPQCHAVPPPIVDRPVAPAFVTNLLGVDVSFAADFGVFSPREIDPGSRLLIDCAARGDAVAAVADVGIGYGAVALSLCAAGVATRACGSEIDSVALWLAEMNGAGLRCALDTYLTADPSRLPPTPLTVCNIPTHIPRAESDHLMDALAARAAHGRLVVVVHSGLTDRYQRLLVERGVRAERVEGPEHCVLDSGA